MADEIDVDGLAGKIVSGIRGALSGSGDEDDLYDTSVRRVPMDRLRREAEKRKAAEQALQELRGEVDELKQGYQTSLKQVRADAAEAVKTIAITSAEDLQLTELGVSDPVARQTLRTIYGQLPAAGRPASAAEYWQAQVAAQKAHLADPKKSEAPKIHQTLQLYLPAAESAAQTGADSQRPPKAPAAPTGPVDLSAIPIDQGMEAFLAGLSAASGGPIT